MALAMNHSKSFRALMTAEREEEEEEAGVVGRDKFIVVERSFGF
jgi:hypothetical protein